MPFAAGSSTDIVPRLVLEQLGAAARTDHRGGEPRRRRRDDRSGVGREGGARWLHRPGERLPAHDLARALSQAQLSSGARLRGRRPVRDFLQRARGFARERIQDRRRSRRGRQGQAGEPDLFVGRRRHRDPSERGTVQDERRVDALHVPFKGGAEAMRRSSPGVSTSSSVRRRCCCPHIKEGTLRALAVNGTSRMSALPEVPTTRETGFNDAEYPVWFGLFARQGRRATSSNGCTRRPSRRCRPPRCASG